MGEDFPPFVLAARIRPGCASRAFGALRAPAAEGESWVGEFAAAAACGSEQRGRGRDSGGGIALSAVSFAGICFWRGGNVLCTVGSN